MADQTAHLHPDDTRDTVLIPLTRGYWATVDRADLILLGGHVWFAQVDGQNVYAARSARDAHGRKKTILMHRVIFGAQPGQRIDHADGVGLNNRRANLRPASAVGNARNARLRRDNSSGYKGVEVRGPGRFRAYCRIGGKRLDLGTYPTAIQAAERYDRAARNLFGGFDRTNRALGLLSAGGLD